MLIKKTDLVFISKLDLEVTLTVKLYSSDNYQGKKSWVLEIETKNGDKIEKGILIGARGEIRRFKQINAIFSLLEEIFEKGTKFEVIL